MTCTSVVARWCQRLKFLLPSHDVQAWTKLNHGFKEKMTHIYMTSKKKTNPCMTVISSRRENSTQI